MMKGKKGSPAFCFLVCGFGAAVDFFLGSALIESVPGCGLAHSSEKISNSFINVGFCTATKACADNAVEKLTAICKIPCSFVNHSSFYLAESLIFRVRLDIPVALSAIVMQERSGLFCRQLFHDLFFLPPRNKNMASIVEPQYAIPVHVLHKVTVNKVRLVHPDKVVWRQ